MYGTEGPDCGPELLLYGDGGAQLGGGWMAMMVPSLKGLPKRSRDADAERMAEARASVVEAVMVQEWPVSMEVLLGSP